MAHSVVTQIQAALTQPDKAPLGGIKWKALFDNGNPISNKILFVNNHTADLLSWYGFQRSKDFTYTSIPLSNEQHTIINNVEAQVEKILSQYEWSRSFKIKPTEKIFPKTDGCIFYEKCEDGRLHRTEPDIEDLHNSPQKSLQVGAVLQITGVFFDFTTHSAKLTFKMLSATYAWVIHANATSKEDIAKSYLSVFGPIAPEEKTGPQQPQNNAMDIVEAAAAVSGITPSTSPPFDKESFVTSLSKLRTVGGIHRRMRQLQKTVMDDSMREWCEQEAQRQMFALSSKLEEKKRRKIEEEAAAPANKKVKLITLQRSDDQLKVVKENESWEAIFSTDEEEMDEIVE